MAGIRPVGGQGARGKKAALPSPQELLGALGQPYGFSARQTSGAMKTMSSGPGGSFASPFAGLPVAASAGEFFEAISILQSSDVMNYYDPQTQKEAEARNQAGQAVFTPSGLYYLDDDGNFVDRLGNRQYYDQDADTNELIIPGSAGPQGGETDAPAPLSLVPTSSINPKRPRTVAAGYDRSRSVLTVVFRDGTFYNYYEVDPRTWQDFKARVSKGQYIYKYLDFHPRGPANVNSLPASARTTLYRIARTQQLLNESRNRPIQNDRTAKTKKRKK